MKFINFLSEIGENVTQQDNKAMNVAVVVITFIITAITAAVGVLY